MNYQVFLQPQFLAALRRRSRFFDSRQQVAYDEILAIIPELRYFYGALLNRDAPGLAWQLADNQCRLRASRISVLLHFIMLGR
jgi:hypothetical protein